MELAAPPVRSRPPKVWAPDPLEVELMLLPAVPLAIAVNVTEVGPATAVAEVLAVAALP